MTHDPNDLFHIKSALALSRMGLGRTGRNPSVGCIMIKDGRVIARARTGDGGRPHAEYSALQQAGAQARGASVYVTLEPCAHEGETPSCARLLVEAGIKKCVFSIRDPDGRTAGQGSAMLRAAGVHVYEGADALQAEDIHRGFILRHTENRPFITLKLATSLDGKIALADGASQWISGAQARSHAHLLRARHDAVAVGVGTILADNPLLTPRIGMQDFPVRRIVFDSALRLSGKERLFQNRDRHPVMIVTKADHDFVHRDVSLVHCDPYDLKAVLAQLCVHGVTRLMVEGGAKLIHNFIQAGLYDQIIWYRSASLIGGDGRDAMEAFRLTQMDQMIHLHHSFHLDLGGDCVDVYQRKH